jgi:hypothetical protein
VVARAVNPNSMKMSVMTRVWSTGLSNMGAHSEAVLAKSIYHVGREGGLPSKTS